MAESKESKISIDKIVDYDGNVYEMACVAMKETERVSSKGREAIKTYAGKNKLASVVLDNVLSGKVKYKYIDDKK